MKKTVKTWLLSLKDHHRDIALMKMFLHARDLEVGSLHEALLHVEWGVERAWWANLHSMTKSGEYFDAPQLTSKVLKDKMVTHMATDEDYEKLEDVVKGIKATVILEAAAPTGGILPTGSAERKQYPIYSGFMA